MFKKLSSEIILQCKKKCSSPPVEVGGDEKYVQNFNWKTRKEETICKEYAVDVIETDLK